MFTLTKSFRFEAAHRLPNHDGICARLHGHSWRGRVIVHSPDLANDGPKAGMLQDFRELSMVINSIVPVFLDHWYLNETLRLENPTSEEVARWLYQKVKPDLPLLVAVEIDETCTFSCRYEE